MYKYVKCKCGFVLLVPKLYPNILPVSGLCYGSNEEPVVNITIHSTPTPESVTCPCMFANSALLGDGVAHKRLTVHVVLALLHLTCPCMFANNALLGGEVTHKLLTVHMFLSYGHP